MKKLAIVLTCISIVFSYAELTTAQQGLGIMTEEFAPFNYTSEGRITGVSTEIVREITTRINQPCNLKMLPWARAYDYVLHRENHALFSTTRTRERENLFKWVGPIVTSQWVFFARKGSNLQIFSLADAKKVKAIGIKINDATEKYLEKRGFSNLEGTLKNAHNIKKLCAGRIDLWLADKFQGIHNAKKIGMRDQIESVYTVVEVEYHIVFNKNTSDAVIVKWQTTLDEIKKDGIYNAILSAYLQ